MEKKVRIKYLRISPKKLRMLLSDLLIIGEKAELLLKKLETDGKKGAIFIADALKSCLSLFEKNKQSETVVKNIIVNEGPRFKRWRPGGRGMAHRYTRRTSHLEVILTDKQDNGKQG